MVVTTCPQPLCEKLCRFQQSKVVLNDYQHRPCTLRQVAESSSTGIDLPLDVEVEFDSLRFSSISRSLLLLSG